MPDMLALRPRWRVRSGASSRTSRRAEIPPSQLATAFCAAIRPAACRGEFPGEDGLQAASRELGKAIYGARKCTIEPMIGIIKEVLGFRQFSLRGIHAAAGEWCLVCLAFNLKRFHTVFWA